jgi:hypothetical protein
MIKLEFNNPIEMSMWINAQITNELLQEQLMYEGVRHKQVNGTYAIWVPDWELTP